MEKIMKRYQFLTDQNIFMDETFLAIKKRENGRSFIARIKWIEIDDHSRSDIKPTLTLHGEEKEQFMQQLVQELTQIKVLEESPTVKGLKAELEATKKHLNDMREIVMNKEKK